MFVVTHGPAVDVSLADGAGHRHDAAQSAGLALHQGAGAGEVDHSLHHGTQRPARATLYPVRH